MRVAIVSGSRSDVVMGLEVAELRLLDALRETANGNAPELRVVGGRGARRYARRVGARWYPARHNTASPLAWRGADLVHLIGLTVPPPRRTPFVATFHDLSPLLYSDEGAIPPWTEEIARRARLLVTPSEFTASELERRLGVARDRVRVVPNGPGQDVHEVRPLSDDELRALGLQRPFVVRTGGFTQRKNVGLLLEAWPAVRSAAGDIRLALPGPPQRARDAVLAAAPSRDGVVVLDYVASDVLPRLVASAAALVSTSRYEGFGLPMLEAMALGTPVVAVRQPFAEEVCGTAALLVDDDPAALATALLRVLQDDDLAERLRVAGRERAAAFDWRRSASLLLDVYREAIARGSASTSA